MAEFDFKKFSFHPDQFVTNVTRNFFFFLVQGYTSYYLSIGISQLDQLMALIVSLSLWGTFLGIASTLTMAMFVDSIPDGSRSRYFTYHMQAMRVAQMMEPPTALLLFGVLGNNWTIQNCSISIVRYLLSLHKLCAYLLSLCCVSQMTTMLEALQKRWKISWKPRNP